MLRQDGFLRVNEAAKVLGVSSSTIRAWGANGKIPEYRHPVNRYRLYKQTELVQILDKLGQSVSTRAEASIKRRPKQADVLGELPVAAISRQAAGA